jgi:hypothetical protein
MPPPQPRHPRRGHPQCSHPRLNSQGIATLVATSANVSVLQEQLVGRQARVSEKVCASVSLLVPSATACCAPVALLLFYSGFVAGFLSSHAWPPSRLCFDRSSLLCCIVQNESTSQLIDRMKVCLSFSSVCLSPPRSDRRRCCATRSVPESDD